MNSVSLFVLVACFVVSIISFFQKHSPLYLRLCPFYLLVTILVQQIGNYMSQHGIHNALLYNCYSIFEFIFYFFILREIIQNKRIKSVILFILITYTLMALFNVFNSRTGSDFHSKTYAIGCIVIVILCITYFVELFQLPKAANLKNEPAFWICTAILFSYVCTFPFWGLVNFMNTAPKIIIKNLMTILVIINILSYSLFTIAFLCRIKIRKSTS
ncbi:MAG: hypothetical protein Q8939_17280 [Bacteroidota bacterium]|nr:hypothetical protein [Bacteroidota bacterium]MDP4212179.1 hypothetical protein [Bacteroidota bacterium]